jgi:hypothetical protein
VSVSSQLLTLGSGSTILPHERPVTSGAGVAVEGDRCLSLIGEPESHDVVSILATFCGHGGKDGAGLGGDFQGVVFDPARAWKVLFELLIGALVDLCLGVIGDRTHPRGTGVEGHDQIHGVTLVSNLGAFGLQGIGNKIFFKIELT